MDKLIETIVSAIEDKKGKDIVSLDLSGFDGAICSHFVVCNADSTMQVAAIADGVEEAVADDPRTDIRIFGKPSARVNRRMGVVVGYEPHGSSLEALRERVCAAAAKVKVTE